MVKQAFCLGALLLCAAAAPAAASSFIVLASLGQGNAATEGYNPSSGVLIGPDGGLYYETANSGANNVGGVFKLSKPATTGGSWTGQVLYSFAAGTDGQNPSGGLAMDAKGDLFGGTAWGGNLACNSIGCGTVFELIPPAGGAGPYTEDQIYAVPTVAKGINPISGVVRDMNGVLYATTYSGGSIGFGNLFKLTPPSKASRPWVEANLHNFRGGKDGAISQGEVLVEASGDIFGNTTGGGSPGNMGTVFRLNPPTATTGWTETILARFAGGTSDGANLHGNLLQDNATGALYGTTLQGGTANLGVVFKLSPPAVGKTGWKKSILYNFAGGTSDGASPTAGLVADSVGNLYGTTSLGGIANSGVIFKLTQPATANGAWTETVLHNFAGAPGDGALPYAGLAILGGTFFGTTFGGGQFNSGTVFEFTP